MFGRIPDCRYCPGEASVAPGCRARDLCFSISPFSLCDMTTLIGKKGILARHSIYFVRQSVQNIIIIMIACAQCVNLCFADTVDPYFFVLKPDRTYVTYVHIHALVLPLVRTQYLVGTHEDIRAGVCTVSARTFSAEPVTCRLVLSILLVMLLYY